MAIVTRSVNSLSWSEKILGLSAAVSIAVVLMAYPMTADRPNLMRPMGPVNWDFRKSWAANLTVFSAAIGTLFAARLLPRHIDSQVTNTFVALNVLFGIAAVVGPFTYTVLQRRVSVTRTTGKTASPAVQYQGTLGGFLLGTTITLWAVLGEILTAGQLIRTIHGKDSLPQDLVVALAILLGFAALLVLAFLATRIRVIAADQQHHEAAFRGRLRVAGVAADDVSDHTPELPPIRVL